MNQQEKNRARTRAFLEAKKAANDQAKADRDAAQKAAAKAAKAALAATEKAEKERATAEAKRQREEAERQRRKQLDDAPPPTPDLSKAVPDYGDLEIAQKYLRVCYDLFVISKHMRTSVEELAALAPRIDAANVDDIQAMIGHLREIIARAQIGLRSVEQ